MEPSIVKTCRVCRQLKSVDNDGKILGHDRFSYDLGAFILCSGSGRLPQYARVDNVRTRGLL